MALLGNRDRQQGEAPLPAVSASDFAIASKADIRRAAEAVRDAVSALGHFRIIISDNIATRHPMRDADGAILAATVFVTEQEAATPWWTHTQLALQSPLARACRYESGPFWANAEGFRTRHPNPHLDAIDLRAFEARALLAAAIVVPVHLPFGQIGMAAFGASDPASADLAGAFEAHADTLLLIARRFITGYVHVTRKRHWLPPNCGLTKREIECLRLAASGKTDRQIAAALDRTHATIRFHLHNAGAKLDAVNRSQTIFKAGQLGYLGMLN